MYNFVLNNEFVTREEFLNKFQETRPEIQDFFELFETGSITIGDTTFLITEETFTEHLIKAGVIK